MASTRVFSIAPNPHWVLIDNFSKLPDGAAIYTYSSLNPSQFKAAFEDPAGSIPYKQPIIGFGNGTMPPIYWEFNPANPADLYYIRVYDKEDVPGNDAQFLWDFNGISGATSGGGGIVTINNDIKNLIVNDVFLNNIGNQAGTPSLPASLTIAPSSHDKYVNDPANANVTANGPVGPDIIFAKNVTTSSDSISFTDFTPLGIHSLPGTDTTPLFFMNYTCSVAPGGETYKYVQFPVAQGVQNTSAQTVVVRIYARCNAGDTTLNLFWRQFYGSGGAPSPDQFVQIGGPITLTAGFQVFDIPTTTPNASTNTLGSCGNDALFLQVRYPLNAITNIDIIKVSVYFGNSPPVVDYVSNDEVNSIINTPRTGDTRTSLNNYHAGWVIMDDGTIGSTASGATTRANTDTYPLFSLIWNLFSANPATQAAAPMFTAAGVPVAYGTDPTSDFVLNRRLSLTRNLGRVMAGALPVQVSQPFTNVGNVLTLPSTASFYTGVPIVLTGAAPAPLAINTTYYAIQLTANTLSLADSVANAILNIPITLTSNVAGTITVAAHPLGFFVGEETHTLTIPEIPSHTHQFDGSHQPNAFGGGGADGYKLFGITSTTTTATGGSGPHNNMQPTVFMNVFMKL